MNETIVLAWAERASGPGWVNQLVWYLVRTPDGALEIRCLQPDEQSPVLVALHGAAAKMHETLTREVQSLLAAKPVATTRQKVHGLEWSVWMRAGTTSTGHLFRVLDGSGRLASISECGGIDGVTVHSAMNEDTVWCKRCSRMERARSPQVQSFQASRRQRQCVRCGAMMPVEAVVYLAASGYVCVDRTECFQRQAEAESRSSDE